MKRTPNQGRATVALRLNPRARLSVVATGAVFLATSCGESVSPVTGSSAAKAQQAESPGAAAVATTPSPSASNPAVNPVLPVVTKAGTPSVEGRKILTGLRARLSAGLATSAEGTEPMLKDGLADAFHPDPAGLRPHFGSKAAGEAVSAGLVLPRKSTGAFHLEDAASGVRVDVSLQNAKATDALVADGYVVYPRAHVSGATLLHRALPSGVEDFLSFEKRPTAASVAYKVELGERVAGLRLVENTLEMLDAGGAPRLRVTPPYLIGAKGARTDAVLAVQGCAFDRNPAGPWGRSVTAPGAKACTVRVSWRANDVAYPAVLDPQWTTTTNTMVSARQEHTATLLTNGKVLVAGGRNGTGTAGLTSAELFDPVAGTWAMTGSFSGPRRLHSATQLGTTGSPATSGKVLVAGGIDGTSSTNTALLYDPTAGSWAAAAAMGTGTMFSRHQHTATLLANGQILVVGGLSGTGVLNTARRFDPASGTGTWTGVGNITPARRDHTATLLVVPGNGNLNNKVLLVGGNSSGGTTPVGTHQLFDPVAGTWSAEVNLPASTAREGHTATALTNGNVLVTGGRNASSANGLTTTMQFNVASGSGTWSTMTGSMATGRRFHTAIRLPAGVVPNGVVLVAGGSSTGSNALTSAEVWNGTSTWSPTSTLPAGVRGHTATLLANNQVLVAGGLNTSSAVTNTARLYDPFFCTANNQCASNFCVSGVCCNTACNGGCGVCNQAGFVGTCRPAASGSTCRMAVSTCDVTETCNGTALTCPTDAFAPSTTTCRMANGLCDNAETCTGTSSTCPTDGFKSMGTSCRGAVGVCDVAEACSGSSAACPVDAFAPSTTTCRIAASDCDVAETCTGSLATCPADALKANGSDCTDGNACTTGESCLAGTCSNGTAVTCPPPTQCQTAGACVPTTGCPMLVDKPYGEPCSDDDLCTTGDFCVAGMCRSPMTACTPVPTISFYQNYQDTTADIAQSASMPVTAHPLVPAEGIFGAGINGATSNQLVYATYDDVSPTNLVFTKPGSVSMWVRPHAQFLDSSLFFAWDNHANLFFSVNATRTTISAYFGQPVSAQSSVPWVPDDRWHLVVVNWSRTSIAVSVDGQAPAVTNTTALLDVPFGPNEGSLVYAGGGVAPNPEAHDKDELLILSRPMSIAEIQWYWAQRNEPQTGPNPAFAFFSGNSACTMGDDLDPCTGDSCNPATGVVQHPPANEGGICSDRNACTSGEMCSNGACTGGSGITCAQPDSCHTQGACVPDLGCPALVQKPDWSTCADTDVCDGLETCHDGSCTEEQAGATTTCASGTRITFYQSFNSGTTNVEIATSGQLTPNADNWTAPLIQRQGLFGLGIASETEPWISYRAVSYTNPPSVAFSKPGSASLWIKLNADYVPGQFFIAYGPGGYLSAGDGGTHMWASLDSQRSITMPRPASWTTDGHWHLVVVNWSLQGLAMSVDGIWSAVSPPSTAPPPAVLDVVNVVVAGGSGAGAVRDELLYLNRPMTRDEVEWYYDQRNAPPTDTNPAIVRFTDDPTSCDPADDLNPCTADACSPSGGVTHPNYADETSCSDGFAWTTGDRCQSGACQPTGTTPCPPPSDNLHGAGTRNPTTGVCTYPWLITPRVDGVVDLGGGKWVAIFGYDSLATTTVQIPPGDTNSALLNGWDVTNPQPAPPTSFLPTQQPGTAKAYVGTFLPTFTATATSSDTVSWRLGGDILNASTNGVPHLTPQPVGTNGLGVLVPNGTPDPTLVIIKPDMAAFTSVPDDPAPAQEPPPRDTFNGSLTGQLSVGPTGAATYSVPISIPPGVGGMAPNLGLVYNSQGGNGIAGQGWELSGLSMIHRCPKTRVADGYARPVVMDEFPNPDPARPEDVDGICLDGQRLFEIEDSPGVYSGHYRPQKADFSEITYHAATGSFLIRTKAGEKRYYGRTSASRVVVPRGTLDTTTAPPSGNETAVWALDRVVDDWGNFFEVKYNGDSTNPATDGLRVTRIDYTGHVNADSSEIGTWGPDVPTFGWVTFGYESRQDVRWTRFGASRMPKKHRLKTISTPAGTYTLNYHLDAFPYDVLLPSRLREIKYCADPPTTPATCLEPLAFEWEGGWEEGQDKWVSASGYAVPASLDSDLPNGAISFQGSQFVDLNGDGLVDFVGGPGGKTVALNTGSSFVSASTLDNLPDTLMKAIPSTDGAAKAILADVDGDGLPDYVRNDAIWMNRITTTGNWVPANTFQFPPGVDFGSLTNPDRMGDINGDGKADLMTTQGAGGTFVTPGLRVYLTNNTGTDWFLPTGGRYFIDNALQGPSSEYFLPMGTDFQNDHLEDINRDGLLDFVETHPSDNVFHARLNAGNVAQGSTDLVVLIGPGAHTAKYETLWKLAKYPAYVGAGAPADQRFAGDIDGDGFTDAIVYKRATECPLVDPGCTLFPCACTTQLGSVTANLALSTGSAYQASPAAAYQAQLNQLNQELPSLSPAERQAITGVVAFADINADGLADMIRADGKELWINTGEHWVQMPSEFNVPVVPTRHYSPVFEPILAFNKAPQPFADDYAHDNGAVFVDLNGDGVVDVIQAQATDGVAPAANFAKVNTFRPPVIGKFPNGRAKKSEVTYSTYTQGNSALDTSALDPKSARFPIPLRVVQTVRTDDGVGGMGPAPITYEFLELRASTEGLGSQGFKTVKVTDPLGMLTTTTYLQVYPYTGLPKTIEVTLQGRSVKKTENSYCDLVEVSGALICTSNVVGSTPLPNVTKFVYPNLTVDTVYLWVNTPSPDEFTTTRTENRYDNNGNLTRTTVEMQGLGEKYSKQSENEYGNVNSLTWTRGKVTHSKVTSRKLLPAAGTPIERITDFEYATFGASMGHGLAKKKAELGRGPGFELHTAYDYDNFGNVTVTTACGDAFLSCVAGAAGPSTDPYRTTQVSYASNLLAAANIQSTVPPYGDGRFPVRVINAKGHTEYKAFDPIRGVLLEEVVPNGIHTRHLYNAFGREHTRIDRSGTSGELVTTTEHQKADLSDGALASVVTVTTAPTGVKTWTYSDVLGRTIRTLAHAFDGGFVQGVTEYDNRGRVSRVGAPFATASFAPSLPAYWTTTGYDGLSRPEVITKELGDTGDGGQHSGVVTFVYNGSWTSTKRTARGITTTTTERKNVLGKTSEMTDPDVVKITYDYDADGNLRHAYNPSQAAMLTVVYDNLGRKTSSVGEDMGTWSYTYNSFGELETQTDANFHRTTIKYDVLGRVQSRGESVAPALPTVAQTATWVYDTAGGAGQGKLAGVVSAEDPDLTGHCDVGNVPVADEGGNRTGRWFTYTAFGDVDEAFECTDSDTFSTKYEYDAFGRQSKVIYPATEPGQRFEVGYYYSTLGFLHYLAEPAVNPLDRKVYWAATAMNAAGQVTSEYTRNGVETVYARNPVTGWLKRTTSTAQAGETDAVIQDYRFVFDEVGNLMSRGRFNPGDTAAFDETFEYDKLDRLKKSTIGTSSKDFAYNTLGNITSKEGKVYTYGNCNAGPHAVCTVGGGAPFQYDPVGNMTAGGGRTITYTPRNKVKRIVSSPTPSQGNDTGQVDFVYNADGDRVVQLAGPVGGGPYGARTVYVGLGATGKGLYERTKRTTSSGTTTEHAHFIFAGGYHGGGAFALRVVTDTGTASTEQMKYFHTDHLGSVTTVSNEYGYVVTPSFGGNASTLMEYDAWGARRNPDGSTASSPVVFDQPIGNRGFTGHETIPNVGLVNMNGRVYDPVIGRFLSPDPNIQFEANLQSYNRYSYVLNNPLSHTDPTGYFMDSAQDWFLLANSLIGIGVCVAAPGVGCAVVAGYQAVLNTTAMVAQGMPWEQAVAINLAGLAGGMVGGGIGGGIGQALQSQVAGKVIGGFLGGMASAAMSTAFARGSLSAENILLAGFQGALWAGVAIGAENAVAVSQGSAQGGGGPGASIAEARARGQASGAAAQRSQAAGWIKRMQAYGGGASSGGVTVAEGFFSDLVDAVTGISNAGARCSAGPCSDATNNILLASKNHLSVGVQGEVTLGLPKFFRGGVGTFGLNLQLSMGGLDESGLFFYHPGPDLKGSGFMIGADVGFNVAIGSGPWSGAFNNYGMAAGPLSMSAFVVPGWQGIGPGYAGLSYGLGWGWAGAAFTQTNYVPLTGQR